MYCGAEVTESSTNKQHHLSEEKERKKRERKKIEGKGTLCTSKRDLLPCGLLKLAISEFGTQLRGL
jgi:hypothetical protein